MYKVTVKTSFGGNDTKYFPELSNVLEYRGDILAAAKTLFGTGPVSSSHNTVPATNAFHSVYTYQVLGWEATIEITDEKQGA
jgi:hypothetical protein